MPAQFVPLAERHIPEATILAQEAFEREQAHVPSLPVQQAAEEIRSSVAHAVRNGVGVAAEESGRLLGFMSFYGPIERFFGTASGAISPLHAHAATGEDRERLFALLFQHAAEELIAKRMTSLAVTAFAHDQDIARALSLNGFGIRNADAIRDLQVPFEPPTITGYTFATPAPDEIMALLPLEHGLIRHLRSSPTFLPVAETSEEGFQERARDARFFVARNSSGIVGYVKVSETGENLLTIVPGMLNITGAFLLPEDRGKGVYDCLVAYVAGTLRDKGVRLLGVDFETMNPAALRFWRKHFDIYTHSYVRRIDDGILDYVP